MHPFQLEPVESAAKRWERWLRKFPHFLVYKGITDEAKKTASLMLLLGDDAMDVATSLGIDATTTFDQATTKLTDYFAPKCIKEYQVYEFRQAFQGPDEMIDQFHVRLKALAKYCEFHDEDGEIKSQIIQKCRWPKVREKGLDEPDVTLAALLKFARTQESTGRHSKVMSQSMSTAPVESKVHKVTPKAHSWGRGKKRQSSPPRKQQHQQQQQH